MKKSGSSDFVAQMVNVHLNISPFFRFVRYHMKRTAGTLVLDSLLPIGAIIGNLFCTFLCFSVYLLGYSYLSVVMDHSHPSMASFWEVRTRSYPKQSSA